MQDSTTSQTSPQLSAESLRILSQWNQNGSQQTPEVQTNSSPAKQSPVPQRMAQSVKANNGDVTVTAPDRAKVIIHLETIHFFELTECYNEKF